jgi:hypothetical protein
MLQVTRGNLDNVPGYELRLSGKRCAGGFGGWLDK